MQTQFVEQKQARSTVMTGVTNSKKVGSRIGGVTSLSPQTNIVTPNSGK